MHMHVHVHSQFMADEFAEFNELEYFPACFCTRLVFREDQDCGISPSWQPELLLQPGGFSASAPAWPPPHSTERPAPLCLLLGYGGTAEVCSDMI